MKITDKLAARQTFSFEIFPPKGDLPLEKAYEVASALAQDRPDWVSVTYSADQKPRERDGRDAAVWDDAPRKVAQGRDGKRRAQKGRRPTPNQLHKNLPSNVASGLAVRAPRSPRNVCRLWHGLALAQR